MKKRGRRLDNSLIKEGPVRILHCVIGNMNVGGIETMLMEIYRHIDRARFQFDFVVHDSNKNAYEDEIVMLGGLLYRVPYVSQNPLNHCYRFRKLLTEHTEYKIVHIHTTYAIMYFDAKIAKKLGRTVIIHSHNSRATKVHTVFHCLFKSKFAALADYRLSCSYIAGNWMYGKASFEIWKNAIRIERFKFNSGKRKEIRTLLGIGEDTLLIGNVARLSYQKNQELLLDIYAEYIKTNSNSRLILVGDGEDRIRLKNKVEDMQLADHIIFTGNVDNVNEYLMAIDIFCLTSRWEGFGVSMVEAVAAGVVVVAPSVIDELVKQLDYVVTVDEYGNIQSWVDKIMTVKPLGEKERKKASKRISELGFDIESQVNTVEKFYSNLYSKLI